MATTQVIQQEISPYLKDYNIHLTGSSSTYSPHDLSTNQPQETPVRNPPNWPADRHRVPPFRPINRDLVWEERTMGSNAAEFVFLNIMFTGVVLNATMAKIWGATAGPYFPGLFYYAIGGEW